MKALLTVASVLALMLVAHPSAAQQKVGLCNSILAKAMGSFNQIARCVDVAPSCTELSSQLDAFVFDPDCFTLLEEQKLLLNTINVTGQSCNLLGTFCETIEFCFGDGMDPTECDFLAELLGVRPVAECVLPLDASCLDGL